MNVLVTLDGRTDWLDPLRWRILARIAAKPGSRVASVLVGDSIVEERALGSLVDHGWVLYRDDTVERPLSGPNVYLTSRGEEAVRSGREWIRSIGTPKVVASNRAGSSRDLRPREKGLLLQIIARADYGDDAIEFSRLSDRSQQDARVLERKGFITGSRTSGPLHPTETGRSFHISMNNRAAWRGASKGRSASSFDVRALRRGTKSEHAEHGVAIATARRIAMDHLVEDPHYYSKNRAVPLAARRFPPSANFTAFAIDTGGTAHMAYQGPSLSTAREKAIATASRWKAPVTVVDEQWNEIATYQPGEDEPDTIRNRARVGEDKQIVVVWLDERNEIVRSRRTDLGERPEMKTVPWARAVMWINRGGPEDLEKAIAYARTHGQGAVAYAYPRSERDPLGRARAQILGLPGHVDVEGQSHASKKAS